MNAIVDGYYSAGLFTGNGIIAIGLAAISFVPDHFIKLQSPRRSVTVVFRIYKDENQLGLFTVAVDSA
jgi:hypothetical protein